MLINPKKKAILDRIKHIEEAIAKGREYLENGKNANWHRFQPWFYAKVRDGKKMPPHKDWMKKVFLPRHERALSRAEKALAKLVE
jgi:hypothetical protein